MIGGLLNRTLQVWRPSSARDPGGGYDEAAGHVGTVEARVSQPTATQRVQAQQAGTDLTDVIYLEPDADVARGDELRDPGTGEVFAVESTVTPSEAVYLRADCTRRQAEESG